MIRAENSTLKPVSSALIPLTVERELWPAVDHRARQT